MTVWFCMWNRSTLPKIRTARQVTSFSMQPLAFTTSDLRPAQIVHLTCSQRPASSWRRASHRPMRAVPVQHQARRHALLQKSRTVLVQHQARQHALLQKRRTTIPTTQLQRVGTMSWFNYYGASARHTSSTWTRQNSKAIQKRKANQPSRSIVSCADTTIILVQGKDLQRQDRTTGISKNMS